MATSLRVLLVEDDANDAALIIRTLQIAGFALEHQRVQTKEDYFIALRTFNPAVILADYNLPQFSALEALHLLNELGVEIPFIIVSGAIGEESAVSAVKEGATDYLLKDRLGRLGSSITHALEEKRLRAEKQAAEEGRLKAEEHFRVIFNNAIEGILQTTTEGQIITANPAMAQIFGYDTPEQLIQSVNDIGKQLYVVPGVRQEMRQVLENHGIVRNLEVQIYRRDKNKIWISLNVHAVRDAEGEVLFYEGSVTEITARKHAEKRLALQYAVSTVLSQGAGFSEISLRILEVVCDVLDFKAGEFWKVDSLGNVLRRVDSSVRRRAENIMVVEGRANFIESCKEFSFASGVGFPGEIWRTQKPMWIGEGGENSSLLRCNDLEQPAFRSEFGFPILVGEKVFGVMNFFAESHEPDPALLQDIETIGRQLGQFVQRSELEQQLRQAQKMEAFGQLAGGVAHDFNNLLTVITGYSNLLLTDEAIVDDNREQINQVLLAAERASNLTRQLLTFSRKRELRAEPLDLTEVVGNMAKMLQRIIGEDVNLRIECKAHSFVHADAGMIEQVLMNLAVNARDAMPSGGRLSILTDFVRLSEEHASKNPEASVGNFVRLAVADSGCGIPTEIRSRIFEPFFTTKGPGKGTGLGLATVYGIVKQHSGWLEVHSEVGVGTGFHVFLPAINKPNEPRPASFKLSQIPKGNETILLVEDEVTLRSLTSNILQRLGYHIIEAESGLAAMAVMEKVTQIDLLFTDMVMPDGMNGFELAARLRATHPDLKVLYSTGYSVALEGHEAELEEGWNFLQKPYHPRKLAETVRSCLDRKK